MAEMDPLLAHLLVHALLLELFDFGLGIGLNQLFDALRRFLGYFVHICQLEHHNGFLLDQEVLDVFEGGAINEVLPVLQVIGILPLTDHLRQLLVVFPGGLSDST